MIRFTNFEFEEKNWSSLEELPFALPTLQAHRGYWVKGERQNSLVALQAAYDVGYRMAETDLRLTKDGKIILFHDPVIYNVDHSQKIRTLTLADLNTVIPVNTLEEVLETLAADLILNLEIKNESHVDYSLEEKLVQFFRKSKHKERVIFSSFNPLSLAWMRNLIPEIPRAQLVTQENESWNSRVLKDLTFVNLVKPHFLNLRWEDMDHYRDVPAERKVVWTLNDISIAKTLLERRKVKGIISDSIKPQDL